MNKETKSNNWEEELKEIYKGLISEGLAVVEYGKVRKLISKTRHQAIQEVLGERDAYKMPFNDNETKNLLFPSERSRRYAANEWYQKGRDDEHKAKINQLKKQYGK